MLLQKINKMKYLHVRKVNKNNKIWQENKRSSTFDCLSLGTPEITLYSAWKCEFHRYLSNVRKLKEEGLY